MDFKVFPYGNAKETTIGKRHIFTCQHGPTECEGNMYEACGIAHNNATQPGAKHADWFPYVYCMEKGEPSTDAEACAKSAGLDFAPIKACAGQKPSLGSDEGNALMHEIAQTTAALNPPHKWTPWVVMNGVPLTEDQLGETLLSLVCKAYTGTKPAGCSSVVPDYTELVSGAIMTPMPVELSPLDYVVPTKSNYVELPSGAIMNRVNPKKPAYIELPSGAIMTNGAIDDDELQSIA